MDALAEISKNTERISDLIGYVDGVVEKKSEELTNIDELIVKQTTTLGELDKKVESKRSESEKEISELDRQTREAQNMLKIVTDELKNAEVERDKVKKEHANFLNYQITAKKALDAKEEALIAREKSLEETVNELKRRRGILGI